MPVARISMMKPLPGRQGEVEKLLDELEEYVSKQEGYILGFRFAGVEDPKEIGRTSLWTSHHHADHVATLNHMVALRARIHRAIQPGHVERWS